MLLAEPIDRLWLLLALYMTTIRPIATEPLIAPVSALCHQDDGRTDDLISGQCHLDEAMQQVEGPGPPPGCPAPCPDRPCAQYLSLNDCSSRTDWAAVRLPHCCEHSVRESLDAPDHVFADRRRCERHVNALLRLDAFVAKLNCQFNQVLLRYDCSQNYSVSNCHRCQEAYRRWSCASLIPVWKERHKVKPCRSVCHTVEQNCPWFLPADKNPGYTASYAGEPVFQCIDANIPEFGKQEARSTYGKECCYEYCQPSSISRSHTVRRLRQWHHRPHQRLHQRHHVRPHYYDYRDEATLVPCMVNCISINVTSDVTCSEAGVIEKTLKERSKSMLVNFPLSSCPSDGDSASSSSSTKVFPSLFYVILICITRFSMLFNIFNDQTGGS